MASYKKKSLDPNSIKKHVVFQGMRVAVDRPKGFVLHGKDKEGNAWSRTYKVDYGFLPKTEGGDGEGVDVFLGPDPKARESYWATQKKEDGSFDEYKVFLGYASREEAKKTYLAHIPEKFLHSIVAMPVQMMKALLGKQPIEKLATQLAFCDELRKIALASGGVDAAE